MFNLPDLTPLFVWGGALVVGALCLAAVSLLAVFVSLPWWAFPASFFGSVLLSAIPLNWMLRR